MSIQVEHAASALERAMHSAERPLAPDTARAILQWEFTDHDNRRMDELIAKSRSVGLDEHESEEFDQLCFSSDVLSILHLCAREAMGELKTPGA